MKINPEDIEVPLEKTVSFNNGEAEVSIASKYSGSEAGLYKSYMSMCSSDDKALANTEGMDKNKTYATCGLQYDKMRAMMCEDSKGELTEEQKKLPPALQKVILEKMQKDGKIDKEESEAAIKKLLSKDDKKESEPKGEEINVVEKK
tara:strand:- start:1299 stop:1739 length:441 start_codon:yes stop_codon:yes gene_type:complete